MNHLEPTGMLCLRAFVDAMWHVSNGRTLTADMTGLPNIGDIITK